MEIDPVEWVPLVWRVVNEMRQKKEPAYELFSEGAMGLMAAARIWKPGHESGAKFMTYAFKFIEGHIKRWRQRNRNYRRCLAAHSKRASTRRLILFSEFGSDFVRGKAPTFAQVPSAEADYDSREEATTLLSGLFENLSLREQRVICMRFGFDEHTYSLDECSRELGITRERVRQIEMRARMNLRDQIKVRELLGRRAERAKE